MCNKMLFKLSGKLFDSLILHRFHISANAGNKRQKCHSFRNGWYVNKARRCNLDVVLCNKTLSKLNDMLFCICQLTFEQISYLSNLRVHKIQYCHSLGNGQDVNEGRRSNFGLVWCNKMLFMQSSRLSDNSTSRHFVKE